MEVILSLLQFQRSVCCLRTTEATTCSFWKINQNIYERNNTNIGTLNACCWWFKDPLKKHARRCPNIYMRCRGGKNSMGIWTNRPISRMYLKVIWLYRQPSEADPLISNQEVLLVLQHHQINSSLKLWILKVENKKSRFESNSMSFEVEGDTSFILDWALIFTRFCWSAIMRWST